MSYVRTGDSCQVKGTSNSNSQASDRAVISGCELNVYAFRRVLIFLTALRHAHAITHVHANLLWSLTTLCAFLD